MWLKILNFRVYFYKVRKNLVNFLGLMDNTSIHMKETSIKMKNSQEMVELLIDKGRLNEPFGVYEGQFNNGEKHGKGKYTFTSKLIYEGNYKLG